jgi:hypothetical protein
VSPESEAVEGKPADGLDYEKLFTAANESANLVFTSITSEKVQENVWQRTS